MKVYLFNILLKVYKIEKVMLLLYSDRIVDICRYFKWDLSVYSVVIWYNEIIFLELV